jgi:hypothetical protein
MIDQSKKEKERSQKLLSEFCSAHPVHCNPGEACMSVIPASFEAGPGRPHMCTFEICIWSKPKKLNT